MLETERNSVIIGLMKIADTKSVSWWMRNCCLKASGMLRAVVDGRIENRRGHWIDGMDVANEHLRVRLEKILRCEVKIKVEQALKNGNEVAEE